MRLPNGERAVVDIEKLRDYCLDADHVRGRHKAAVFASALGMVSGDAIELRVAILEAALRQPAVMGERDGHGQRYVLDFSMTRGSRAATVRTAWMVRNGEEFPRLLTCFVVSIT